MGTNARCGPLRSCHDPRMRGTIRHGAATRAIGLAACLALMSGCSQNVTLSDVTTYSYRQGDDGRWLLEPSRREVGELADSEERLAVAVDVLLGDEAVSPAVERTKRAGPLSKTQRAQAPKRLQDVAGVPLE